MVGKTAGHDFGETHLTVRQEERGNGMFIGEADAAIRPHHAERGRQRVSAHGGRCEHRDGGKPVIGRAVARRVDQMGERDPAAIAVLAVPGGGK
jgi:hypothetical protein